MLLNFLVMAAAAASQDPLAPAAQGKAQCYLGDLQSRVCESLAYYERTGPSTYRNRAIVLVDAVGPLTIETTTAVTIKGAAVCGYVKAADTLAGKVRVGGQAVPPSQAKEILSRFNTAMASLRSKEICTRYEPAEDGLFAAKVTVGGARRPELDQMIAWVDPADFQVAR